MFGPDLEGPAVKLDYLILPVWQFRKRIAKIHEI
jgi:hypothetical protein